MQMLHETYHCNAFVRSCHLDKAKDERLIIPALQKSMVWCVSHYFLSIREDPCLSRGRYGKCLGVYIYVCVCVPTWDEVGDGQTGTSFTAVSRALVAGRKQDVTVPQANLRP